MKLIFLLFTMLFISAGLEAKIYKHVDSNGKVYFSDVPVDNATEVVISDTNLSSIDDKDKSWSDFRRQSEPMQISFSEIPLTAALELIAEHAKNTNGVTVKFNLLKSVTIKIEYERESWAKILDEVARENNLHLDFKFGVVSIYDHPSYRP